MCGTFQYTTIQPKANASVKCKKYYTGEEHLIGYLQGHTTLHCKMPFGFAHQNPIQQSFHMYGMTCASNLSSNILTNTKSVNPDVLRIALYKFINMLKFDKKKTWDCTYCKHAPKLV